MRNGESDVTWSYTYDDQKRLDGATRAVTGAGTTTYDYVYDDACNRTEKTVNGSTTTYTYNSLDQLISDGTTTYIYDEFGIRIEDCFYVTEDGGKYLGDMLCNSLIDPFGT